MSTFFTGNTGRSTGPHLDFRVYNPASNQYEDPSSYTSYLTVGADRTPFNFEVTSGRGMRTHPVTGGQKMHEGIDYATPSGTQVNVNGKLLSTWNDEGGGIMSQYLINTDAGSRELLLLHGSDQNAITSSGAITDYDIDNLPSSAGPTPSTDKPAQSEAKTRVKAYKDMSKAEMNAAYDAMRSKPNAAEEGMKMHKAYFRKT